MDKNTSKLTKQNDLTNLMPTWSQFKHYPIKKMNIIIMEIEKKYIGKTTYLIKIDAPGAFKFFASRRFSEF